MHKFTLLIFSFFTATLFAQNIEWANTLGGSSTDKPAETVLDAEGNVYVAGTFLSTVGFSDSAIELEAYSASDIFLFKRSPAGDLLWAQKLGGYGDNKIYDMAVDQDGNIFIAGAFLTSMTAGSGANSISLTSAGQNDGFIAKYASGGDLLAAYALGDENDDRITTVAFDMNNNIILSGQSGENTDFDFGSGTETVPGTASLFFLKLNSDFEFISVFKAWGDGALVRNLFVSDEGDYIISGLYFENIQFDGEFPNVGLSNPYDGSSTGFVIKITGDGYFLWGANIFGADYQDVMDMVRSETNDLYLTGEFKGSTSFFSAGSPQLFESTDGSRDIFYAKLSPSGEFEWIKIIGGAGLNQVSGIELDGNGNILLGGSYTDTMDFDPSTEAAELVADGEVATYISKYNSAGEYLDALKIENESYIRASNLALGSQDEIYIAGWFTGSVDFAPFGLDSIFDSAGNADTYFLKMNWNTVGLSDPIKELSTDIFPNPATTAIQIKAERVRLIEVFDARGKLVLKKSTSPAVYKHSLNISNLSPGSYFIRLRANDGAQTTNKVLIFR